MEIYAAIDIRGGRLARSPGVAPPGRVVLADDPLAEAERLVAAGARWLHVVDMDRALGTGGDNRELVWRVCHIAGVNVQVGGNVGDVETAQQAVGAGAERVVFGTVTALDPELLERLVETVGPGRSALGIDVHDRQVALRGRGSPPGLSPMALAQRARLAGIETVVYRDLDRDGQLAGADLIGTTRLVGRGVAVIVAGGVGALDDIVAARELGLDGVIVGRALYEGRFTLAEAIACSRSS